MQATGVSSGGKYGSACSRSCTVAGYMASLRCRGQARQRHVTARDANNAVPASFQPGSRSSEEVIRSLSSNGRNPRSLSPAPQDRIDAIKQGLVDQLKQEAGERVALQQQLAEAQAHAVEFQLAAESAAVELEVVRKERAALESKADVQGAHLAMLESRMTRMHREVEALQAEAQASAATRNILLSERDNLQAQLLAAQQAHEAAAAQSAAQLVDARQAIQALEANLAASVDKQRFAEDMQALVAVQLTEAQCELEALSVLQRAALEEVQALRTAVTTAQAAQVELEARLVASARELAASQASARSMVSQDVVAGLRSQLEAAGQERTVAVEERTQAQAAAVVLAQQLQEAGRAQALAEGSSARLESQLVAVHSDLEATRAALADLSGQLSAVQRAQPAPVVAASAAVATGGTPGNTSLAAQPVEHLPEIKALSNRLKTLQMQLESSHRERQLEVAVLVANFRNAQEQGAGAAAQVKALQERVSELCESNVTLQAELEKQLAIAQVADAAQKRVVALRDELYALQARMDPVVQARDDARQDARTARAAEAAIQQQLEAVQARLSAAHDKLALTEDTLARRTAGGQLLRQLVDSTDQALPAGAHLNINRYWAPRDQVFDLMKALACRERTLSQLAPGFTAMTVTLQGEQIVAAQLWENSAAFEAWHSSPGAVVSLAGLPPGARQYPPAHKGEGLPETFLPWKSS